MAAVIDALVNTRKELGFLGEFARPETEIIFEHLLKCSRPSLYLASRDSFPESLQKPLGEIIARRLAGEPLAYILGSVYFYNREFVVTPDVLIPRPDTETLVEVVLRSEAPGRLHFADAGTGSGVVACVLAHERPQWKATAFDISPGALKIARHNCGSKVNFIQGDFLGSCRRAANFDFIVSNPPYLSDRDMDQLDPGVRDFEPLLALYGGPDGLHSYRRLAQESVEALKDGGRLYCEIGCSQAAAVREILECKGWKSIEVFKDIARRDRVVRAQRR